MILSSTMKNTNSTEIAVTGDWTFTDTGAIAKSATSKVEAHSSKWPGTLEVLYNAKEFTFGLKLTSTPFHIKNTSSATDYALTVTCSAAGVLTVNRSRGSAISANLVALGVELTDIRLELFWCRPTSNGYDLEVYVNGYRIGVIAGQSSRQGQIASFYIDGAGTGANNKPVEVRDAYFKLGPPLRNWSVHELKVVADNRQGGELGQANANDVRAKLRLVGNQPLQGAIAQLHVEQKIKQDQDYAFENTPAITLSHGTPLAHLPNWNQANVPSWATGASESALLTDIDAVSLQELSIGVSTGVGNVTVQSPVVVPSAQLRFKTNAVNELTGVEAELVEAVIDQGLVLSEGGSATFESFTSMFDFTVELKVHLSSAAGTFIEGVGGWSIDHDDTLKFKAHLGDVEFVLDSGTALEVNVDYHIAVVNSLGFVTIYVNGQPTVTSPMYGRINRCGSTIITAVGVVTDVRLCHSAAYTSAFDVHSLDAFERPEYEASVVPLIVSQVEFDGEYETFEYEPVIEEDEGDEEPEEPTQLTGFLGEVSSADLITGDALAADLGLTAGISQFSDEPWLHFIDPVDGKTKYVAKKPYRHTVRWDHIQAVNAVYGSRTIVINGKTYKVRLLKGSATDPYVGEVAYDPIGAYGSEWNRLFYPLVPNPTNAPSKPSGEGIEFGSWADYTETELVLVTGGGNGNYSWCQETNANSTGQRVSRGLYGVTYLVFGTSSLASVASGWRPVLELVE